MADEFRPSSELRGHLQSWGLCWLTKHHLRLLHSKTLLACLTEYGSDFSLLRWFWPNWIWNLGVPLLQNLIIQIHPFKWTCHCLVFKRKIVHKWKCLPLFARLKWTWIVDLLRTLSRSCESFHILPNELPVCSLRARQKRPKRRAWFLLKDTQLIEEECFPCSKIIFWQRPCLGSSPKWS